MRALLRPFLPRVPLARADWWVILLLWLTGVAMGWSQGQASTLLPFIRVDFAVTASTMSLVLSVARVAAFGSLLVGVAADRVGRRRPLMLSLVLLLISSALGALVDSPFAYGLTQSGARVGGASVAAVAVVVMAEGVTPAVRAYAISFFGAAASLGAGLSVLTLPLATATRWGWRLPHALPLVLIVLVPFIWTRLPEPPHSVSAQPNLPWQDLMRGERGRRLVLVGSASLLASAFTSVALAFTTERLTTYLGFSAGTTVLVVLGGGALGGLGFFVGGRLADGWGRRPTSILAMLLGLAGGLLLYRVTTPAGAAAAAAVSGFGSFAYISAGGAHRAELFPTRLRAGAGTASNYLATVGSALGLLIGAITIDRIGIVTTVTLLGFGMLAAVVFTALLPETLGEDLSRV